MKKILLIFCIGLIFMNISCVSINESVKKGTIKLTVDTKNITGEKTEEADWYDLTVKSSNDLQFIIVTITITDENYIAKKCKLVINGEEIDSKNYTIDDYTITYKMEDPNWSEFI